MDGYAEASQAASTTSGLPTPVLLRPAPDVMEVKINLGAATPELPVENLRINTTAGAAKTKKPTACTDIPHILKRNASIINQI